MEHDLPVHLLSKVGFRSIGCAPCTEIISPAEQNDRAGRWARHGKLECRLHTEMFSQKDVSEVKPEFHLNLSALPDDKG